VWILFNILSGCTFFFLSPLLHICINQSTVDVVILPHSHTRSIGRGVMW